MTFISAFDAYEQNFKSSVLSFVYLGVLIVQQITSFVLFVKESMVVNYIRSYLLSNGSLKITMCNELTNCLIFLIF